ncbi:MAG: cysteine desulfurase family protein [bacterium]
MKTEKNTRKVYLDYAATTPLDTRALKAMLPYFSQEFGNTMSLHTIGQQARAALETSREIIADLINADPEEIIFTSSATESNNLALKGIAWANKERGRHIIISAIEHACVVESSQWLKSQGFAVTVIPVDRYGLVNPKDVEKAIRKDTILVSIIHASNEIGTIEPISQIGRICRERGVYFHTDASQSFGKILINVKRIPVDLLTASSHKIYGPKGAALLFVRQGVKISPLLSGGGQETGLRSSTINVPAIVGFAEAAKISHKEMKKEGERLKKLRIQLIAGVLGSIEGSYLNGHPQKRLANNASFRFDFIEGESLIISLNRMGISASTGSACSSSKLEPSHVLLAIGLAPHQAHGSLRISLGRATKPADINYVLTCLQTSVARLREISPFKSSH